MKYWATLAIGILILVTFSTLAQAHCDTLDGPVVQAAREALDKGNITPVLKWIKKDQESEIRAAFEKTLAVRSKGPEAKELADHYFFETLVRIHRAGEGAPYTGLSSAPADPIIRSADEALEKGSADHLIRHVTEAIAGGIRKRFAVTAEKKKHAEESVAAGREFVEAYVDFTHYVERLHLQTQGGPEHGHAESVAPHPHK